MSMPGGFEWLVILGIVLILFGPTQLPKLAKMVGKSFRSLKDAANGVDTDDEPKQPPQQQPPAGSAPPAGTPPKNGH